MTMRLDNVPEGFAPWYPKLVDVRYRGEHGDDKQKAYFGKFGIDRCVWSEAFREEDKQAVIGLFNSNFDYRMIGYETLEEWQSMLQNTLDIITPRYVRAFSMYNDPQLKVDMLNVKRKRTTSIDTQNQASGTDKNKREGKVISTPDTIINASDNYADSLSKDSSDTVYGRNDRRTGIITETDEPEGGIVQEVNDNIDRWRNLIHDMVLEFDRHFKQVMWY